MLPNPSDLKYFLELYNVKNISRAAERLGITQPSLSVSLQRLEELLKIKLFVRSKSGVHATREADVLAKDVEILLSDWQRIGDKAKGATLSVAGNIKVGCHPSVALYAVDLWVNPLLTKNKDLEITFVHDLSRKILEQVISFKIDIGLVINPVSHPDLVILKLIDDQITLRCSKKIKFDKSTLVYDPALAQVQSLLQVLKKKKIEFKRHITTSSLELVEKLTSEGVGVGILPLKVCKIDLDIFDKNIKSIKDELCLIYRADLPKTKSFEVTLDEIKKAFI